MNKKIISLITILISIFSLSGCFNKKDTTFANLVFYGLDNSEVIEPYIKEYKASHANVQIKYKKFNDSAEFENLLINEIAEGEGPDIFYVHNTWLPRHLKKLVPLQSASLTPEKMPEIFVKVVSDDFVQPDPKDGKAKIYALPLYVDTLALYYNKKDFEQKIPERGKPSNNWDIFKDDAPKLREQSQDGKLKHGIIALGRADNIRLATDILYNFFLQAGVDFYDKDFKRAQFSDKGKETFEYFLNYALPSAKNFSWSTDLVDPGSKLGEVEAFLAGKTSSVLAYSDLYRKFETEIKNVASRGVSVISINDIGVMPLPQISTNEKDYKVWANYYGLGVSRNSKYPTQAWDFIQFMASKEKSKFYHQQTKKPAARRDLIEEQKVEPVTDVFVSQVGYAGSFRIFSESRFNEILVKAIEAANGGQNSQDALGSAQESINAILKSEAPEGLYPKPKGNL